MIILPDVRIGSLEIGDHDGALPCMFVERLDQPVFGIGRVARKTGFAAVVGNPFVVAEDDPLALGRGNGAIMGHRVG